MKQPERKFTPLKGTLDEPNRLHGYIARFGEESQVLFDKNVCKVPFIEVIRPGAFAKTLRENDDIRALMSHKSEYVLGRTRAGTLKLDEDESGLHFENLLPDTSFARDLRVSMGRGDIDGCSFYGYVIADDVEIRPGMPALRTIHEISLIEVTPATAFPAYLTATASLRAQYPQYFEATEDAPDPDTGVMVALFIPPEVASGLAIDGGEHFADLHVTLCYLGRISEVGSDRIDQLRSLLAVVASSYGALSGTIGGTGRFPASISSDGMGVLYAGVDVPGLVELRQAIVGNLECSGFSYKKDHGFTPHVTLSYVDPSSPMGEVLESRPVAFEAIYLAMGDERIMFPLGSAPAGYPVELAIARLMLSDDDD